MRILHIWTASDFAQFLTPLVKELAVILGRLDVASSAGRELAVLVEIEGVSAHAVEMQRGFSLAHDLRTLPRLVKLIREIRPDIVHAHTPKAGLLSMLAATATGVPGRVYQMHGLRYQTARGSKRAILLAAERVSASLAHRVVCVSRSVRTQAAADGVLPESKALVFSTGSAAGIDVPEFDADTWRSEASAWREQLGVAVTTPCVLFAGRLAKDKGLADLEQAWLELRSQHPEAHLLLAGQEDPTDPIDLPLLANDRNVHFLGQIEEMRPLYALADLFVLPSYREGLPQGILEAGAMQKPVVATRVTGCVDAVIDGKTGVLVPPHSPGELAAAISSLLSDKELRDEMGRNGREFVLEKFQRQPIIDQTLALYEELLRK